MASKYTLLVLVVFLILLVCYANYRKTACEIAQDIDEWVLEDEIEKYTAALDDYIGE